ncbi:MAG: Calx-beta domain-containing protein, partial [Vicinamibacterales bacterium]
PDGEHIVAQVSISRADGSNVCNGIARLTIDGTPDAGFGRNGLTCLNHGLALFAVQSDGAPLFGYEVSIFRLLPDNSPSPGFLQVVATGSAVSESQGTVTVAIERFAGSDGAASLDYATAYRPPYSSRYPYPYRVDSATAGSDYAATSGRLDWASGDDSPRTVTVRILDDDIHELRERFGVDFSGPGGGAQLIDASATFSITDDDEASSTPPPTDPTDPRDSGGGGSVSWATQLALLTLLFIRRRRVQHAAAC